MDTITPEGYPDCHIRIGDRIDGIGDGSCSQYYNTEECGYDGGDCLPEVPEVPEDYPCLCFIEEDCLTSLEGSIGDGACIEQCNYWIVLLVASDVDSSDGISESEYVSFLSSIDEPQYISMYFEEFSSFDDLPWVFRVVHKSMACNCVDLGFGDNCCDGSNAEILISSLASGTLVAKSMSSFVGLGGAGGVGAGGIVTSQTLQPLDVLVVQANTNVLSSHFVSLACLLWLTRMVDLLDPPSLEDDFDGAANSI